MEFEFEDEFLVYENVVFKDDDKFSVEENVGVDFNYGVSLNVLNYMLDSDDVIDDEVMRSIEFIELINFGELFQIVFFVLELIEE